MFHPKVTVLHDQNGLVVLNKPAGLLTHPNRDGETNAVVPGPYDRKSESYSGAIFLVHRLDKETSGVLLCARNRQLAERLKSMFESRQMEKEYRAVVFGSPSVGKGTWAHHLEKAGSQMRAVPGPPNAFSEFELCQQNREFKISLLAVRPQTGKTHQIRVQAAKSGLKIVGDERYGDFQKNKEFKKKTGVDRMLLHALRISFDTLSFEAELPGEMRNLFS
jgi:tRNA pseudouridine65 synthase